VVTGCPKNSKQGRATPQRERSYVKQQVGDAQADGERREQCVRVRVRAVGSNSARLQELERYRRSGRDTTQRSGPYLELVTLRVPLTTSVVISSLMRASASWYACAS